ncbi:MAG TPA: methyl-accepting chemotaxis protein [Burkholderiaceae bacterium]|nr:methyl-accepting chemotaxis protein [Burkholderiaceae bacterium]
MQNIASTPAASDGGYFEHHGLWAVGVRLFRHLQFRTKAALITFAFGVPLAVLAWSYFVTVGGMIEIARTERRGVAAIEAINPLLDALQTQRNAVATGRMARAQTGELDSLWSHVKKSLAERGAGFELDKVVARLDSAMKSVQTEGHAASLQDAVQATAAVVAEVVDRSTLSLDPDVDTYYLMSVGTGVIPQLNEQLARMQGLLTAKDAATQAQKLYAHGFVVRMQADELASQLGKTFAATPDATQHVKIDAPLNALRQLIDPLDAALASGQAGAQAGTLADRASSALSASRDLRHAVLTELDRLIAIRESGLGQRRLAVTALLVVSLLSAAYLFYAFFLVVDGGLKEVRRHLVAMTDGDLTTSPRPWGMDEAAQLMLAMVAMQQSLRRIVHGVRESADLLVQSSSEIATGAADLSARTEQTAANLQQAASSMEQIAATVRQTAESSTSAAAVAKANADVASHGGRVVGDVVTTMQEIAASSNRISEITHTIDGIAFQTNILALNAAVEAARAGEQGRGFAVVAGEVRSLAQRSANAAKEIAELIADSVARVESGARVVQGAGDTMNDLVANATRLNEWLAQISTAAHEQNAGVGQVGSSVQDLDRMTQQNSALVEQTASAAETLKSRAQDMAAQVARFRLPAAV